MDILEISKAVFLCLFAYLMGSIPFGYIISWAKGVDIQTVGSGNIGGSNVSRSFGLRYGLWAGALDAWKGAVPLILAVHFAKVPWLVVGFVFLSCMLGAVFSVWLKIKTGKFRAGKGVAALLGGLLVLAQGQVLIFVACWILAFVFLVKRKISAASLIAAASLLMLSPFIPALIYIWPILIAVVGLIWWAHRENIKRLIENKEPSVNLPKKLPSFFHKLPDDLIGSAADRIKRLFRNKKGLS